MADLAFGSVGKIIDIARRIKEAVETVKQNEEGCLKMKTCVANVKSIIEHLEKTLPEEIMKGEMMRNALKDLSESLQEALELVTKCQQKHLFRRLLGAADMAKDLHRVRIEISLKVTIGNFANSALQNSFLISMAPPPFQPDRQAIRMEEHSHGAHPTGDARFEKKKSKVATESEDVPSDPFFGLTKFSMSELEAATNNFSDENILGKGSFGVVFKGILRNGLVAAIKRFYNGLHDDRLLNECNVGVTLDHKNVVKVLGYCISDTWKSVSFEGRDVKARYCERMLVLRYMPNGSLAERTYRGTQRINWPYCFRIIQEIAQGLHYLHERKIVHLDLKPDNILFDSDMNPVIADFGLSKSLEQEIITTPNELVGTVGYMAPEYISSSIVSKKNDVFSFGVVVLRTMASVCTEADSATLSRGEDEWDDLLQERGRMRKLFDPTLVEDTELMDAERCLKIGLLCIQFDPADRPTMADVLEMLDGSKELPALKKRY